VLAISKQAQQQRYATVAGINGFAARHEDPDRERIDRQLTAYFQGHPTPGVRYVSMLDVQCGPARRCEVLSPDGRYLYFDAGHFTLEGSRRFGARLRRAHPELF
jgi:hypothetical protein